MGLPKPILYVRQNSEDIFTRKLRGNPNCHCCSCKAAGAVVYLFEQKLLFSTHCLFLDRSAFFAFSFRTYRLSWSRGSGAPLLVLVDLHPPALGGDKSLKEGGEIQVAANGSSL